MENYFLFKLCLKVHIAQKHILHHSSYNYNVESFCLSNLHLVPFPQLKLLPHYFCQVVAMWNNLNALASFINSITHNASSNVRSTTSKRHLIPDHTASMRHSPFIGYKRSSFHYFNSYQILFIYKLHAFGMHNRNHTSRGFNGNIFKDVNTLEILFVFGNILRKSHSLSMGFLA